jgi:hypothetical protein
MNTRKMSAACAIDSKNIHQHLWADSLTDHGASLLSGQYYARLKYIVSRIENEHTDKYFVKHDGGNNVSYQYNILPFCSGL